MKNLLYFALLFLVAGCAEESAHSGQDSASRTDSVARADSAKRSDTAAAAETAASPVPTDTVVEKQFTTRLEFTFTTAYCGGARPSEEIIADKNTPRPLRNSTLLLKNHFSGEKYSFTTNDDGVAQGSITEGKYDVYLTNDINPKLGTGFDGKCSVWRNTVMFTVKVTDDGKLRSVPIHFTCNPCDDNMKRRP